MSKFVHGKHIMSELKKPKTIASTKKIKRDTTKEKLDARSMDTLYRTLSRNHYNLLRMVDNKASIMLTVNSIFITLLYGGTQLVSDDGKREDIQNVFAVIIFFCVGSMIFSLLAMLPHTYNGKRFKENVYKGNLYAGNFAKDSIEQFQLEMERVTAGSRSVFYEMTQDLYFLGISIKRKQRMIKYSLFILLVGLIAAVVYAALSR